MTVCVPLVVIEGDSYRLREAEQALTKKRPPKERPPTA
jgi:hypothetical protein